jgi:hypothetical protein
LVVLIQRVKRRRNVAFIIAVALKYWKSTYYLESSSGSLQQRQQCAGREAFVSIIFNMPIDVSNKLAKARGI